MTDPDAKQLAEEMAAEPTLDRYFRSNPRDLTNTALVEYIEGERRRREAYIKAEKVRK